MLAKGKVSRVEMPEIKMVKMPIGDIIYRRMLRELVLVKILRLVDKDGKDFPKEWVLKELELCIKAEREYIKKYPEKAILVYSFFFGGSKRVAKETIKHILTYDYLKHYSDLIKKEDLNV